VTDFEYVGTELDLFSTVHNWKSYWSSRVRPFITGDVLEVGAGIGSNTRFLDAGGNGRWVCLEPDRRLTVQLEKNLAQTGSARRHEIVCGTLATLEPSDTFDTIIYIDVVEHIQDDRQEMQAAARRVRAGGRIIVLSPAHQWLFTPFDAQIGHFRRYNRPMMRAVSPPDLRLERLFYLDSVGLALSLANLLLLRQSMPTKAQLQVWDRCVIPVSRVVDRCLFSSIGKTIVGVWRKDGA
jgi:SAM-dependent methyltransferase